MKRFLLALLLTCAIFLAGRSVRLTSATAEPRMMAHAVSWGEAKGDLTLADISRFEWVDKRCRMWAADGDIDVDQTCLVVKTVRGGVVVIPNEHNDVWLKEISDQRASADKWIQRFFAIGGGAKLR